MNIVLIRVIGCALLSVLVSAMPLYAQGSTAPRSVTLDATGTFAKGGEFAGTVTINRFEQRDNGIVAIGLVRGVLTQGSRTVGTVLAGDVVWPVVVRSGGIRVARGAVTEPGELRRTASSMRLMPVQAPETCPVLDVVLAPVNVDLLGFQVALDAIGLNLAGEVGTPVGDLVCAVSDLIGNVAGVVDLLNSILGLLTGLLGGLTGGLGGVTPPVPGVG